MHSTDRSLLVAVRQIGRRHVKIVSVEPVGHYAIRIVFDDKHDTGIYSWSYLHELGREHELRWKKYLQELADKGLKRAP